MTLHPARLALLAAVALAVGAPCLAGFCSRPAVAQDGNGEGKGEGDAGAADKAGAGEEVKGTVFHFGTAEPRTSIQFESETDIEVIHGKSTTMSGSATFDWDAGKGAVDFTVPVAGMTTDIATRDEHMRSETWLDAAKYPEIKFEATRVTRKEKAPETWVYEGFLTIHGVRKPLKGEAEVKRIDEKLGKRLGPGEWIRVKAEFPVTLKDFDIEVPGGQVQGKVSPTWKIKVMIFGTSKKPKQ